MKRILIHQIDMKQLCGNPDAPQHPQFDALVESIMKYGLISPVIVTEKFKIVDGESRYRAMRLLKKNPISVLRITEEQADEYKRFYRQ